MPKSVYPGLKGAAEAPEETETHYNEQAKPLSWTRLRTFLKQAGYKFFIAGATLRPQPEQKALALLCNADQMLKEEQHC